MRLRFLVAVFFRAALAFEALIHEFKTPFPFFFKTESLRGIRARLIRNKVLERIYLLSKSRVRGGEVINVVLEYKKR